MIYIIENSSIYVPITGDFYGNVIVFENQTTHKTVEYGIECYDKYYYKFDIETFSLTEGQYTYKIMNGTNVIDTGIAQFGNFTKETIQFTDDKITYKTFKY